MNDLVRLALVVLGLIICLYAFAMVLLTIVAIVVGVGQIVTGGWN